MVASRGVLVVNAAGNEGNTSWQYITAPADADSVLAVGSVDEWENYSAFSSTGPTFDDRIKPDLAAMGGLTITLLPQGYLKTGNGTSFACPLIAGLAACLWQADTNISNMELFSMIKNSGNRALFPDDYLGWGIPQGDSVYFWLTGKNLPNSVHITNALTVYPNPSNGNMQFSYINYEKEQEAELGVFDSQGREIITSNFKLKNGYQVYPLDLSLLKLRKGLYYLRIKAGINVQVFENKLSICE